MLRLLIVSGFICCSVLCFSQSDFISVRKKNGRHVKTFIQGSPIIFKTVYGSYVDGWINDIKEDSVFVKIYDVRRFTTNWGSMLLDTVNSSIVPFYYKEISTIKISNKRRFVQSKIDKLLVIGGAGYLLLNLANGGYLNESVTGKKNVQSLGIALGAIASGLLIKQFYKPDNFSRKKHRIVYVSMKQKGHY